MALGACGPSLSDALWGVSVSDLPRALSPPGTTPVTNRENIQKAISRLDEDLRTLGQMSKLSETLAFPHQVCAHCLSRGRGEPLTLLGTTTALSFSGGDTCQQPICREQWGGPEELPGCLLLRWGGGVTVPCLV